MATMQVASQQTQSPVAQGAYAIDPSSSRLQYTQQSPQPDNESQSSHERSSPQSSSRRPTRRPSGNGNQTIPPDSNVQSTSSTPRGQDMVNVTRASPVAPGMASSPPLQTRRDQRTQQSQQGGPPISPPPRTSSNQRAQKFTLPSSTPLADRKVSSRQTTQPYDDTPSSSRKVPYARQLDTSEQGTTSPASGNAPDSFSDSNSAAANVTRSRRRGPASPDGPQRAISTREPGHQQSPAAVQSRSASNVVSQPLPAKSTRDETQVINRVVVDDPAIDIRREQERQLESMPGLAVVNNVAAEDVTNPTPRSRQDYSATAGSGGRRKETKFGEYILGQTLGEGEFGKVKLGWKKNGEVQVAIKLIRRETLGQNPSRLPKIYREVSILRGLEHPNIVKLHEMIETPPYIGIILEYASGGELFDYILNHRYLKDYTARKLFAQLVSGVGYLHKKGIVHRDLKLENLLLDRNKNIVITDFGFANTFDPRDELDEDIERNLTDRKYVKDMNLDRVQNGSRRGDLMATSCGSPCYAAPELVVTDSLYTGRKVDVWSCGVILYAMLAGYLPFDDDPANPEGDNINLLYKYITTTPLTFPEYVTPHARDLLRRILVPDPRQRADLFEVARHSWLSDFAHVVAQVTSSTTTVGDIANATVTADPQDVPLLVRSASVREPAKTHPSNMSPGGLNHQGKIDPDQSAGKAKAPRDPKRRTVQVEYVAPQRQTVRGEPIPPTSPPTTDPSTSATSAGQPRTRVRAGTEGPQGVSSQYRTPPSTTKPLPQDPPIALGMGPGQTYQSASSRTQQRPGSSQRDMAPPARPPKDLPRSVSDSTSAFGQVPSTSIARPSTGGSMTSTGQGRLPSRGNSYSQPLAPTVAATNAQGRVTQPKPGKQYNISAPIPQPEAYLQNDSIGRPSTHQYEPSTLGLQRNQSRGHKRSNTLGNFFRVGSISGGRPQPQSPGEPQREKGYPPTSMKTPMASDSPRQSTDSRRPSFGFSRKNSDLRKESDPTRQEKPRRFSLLPASFSFKTFASTGSGKDASDIRPASERRPSNTLQQAPASRGQSRPQTMAYNKGQEGGTNYRQEENIPAGYDGGRDRTRDYPTQQGRRNDPPSRGAQQNTYSPQYQSQPDLYPSSKPPLPGQSYLGTPTESEISLGPRRDRPLYPQGFNSYEDEPPSAPAQQGRARGPGVLQKNNRRFADAYEQNTEQGSGVGGQHAGTSGAAKRVMDFFRRRGKARTDDRM